MWCVANNDNYMCHICAKEFLDSNFNEAVIDKKLISIFTKLPQIPRIRINRNFLSIFATF